MEFSKLENIVSLLKSIEENFQEDIKMSYVDIFFRKESSKISFYITVTENNYNEIENHIRKCVNEKEFNIGFMPDIGRTFIQESIEEVQKTSLTFIRCINVILMSK